MELSAVNTNSDGASSASSSEPSSWIDENYSEGDFGDDSTHGDRLPAVDAHPEEKPMVGKKISNTFRWKLFVIALMFVNTSVVIAATSLFLNNEADKEYTRAFNNAAETVQDAVHYHAKEMTDGLDVLGDMVTSFVMDSGPGTDWPFITLPGFEERVATVRKSSVIEIMGFLPAVKTLEREDWEAYSVREQGWIQESYEAVALRGTLATTDSRSNINSNTDTIFNNESTSSWLPNDAAAILESPPLQVEDYSISPTIAISSGGEYVSHPNKGPYTPLWQVSPPPPPADTVVVNTDLLTVPAFRLLFESFVENQSKSGFATSPVMPLSIYSTKTIDDESTTATLQSARSVLFHPIYETYGHGNHQGGVIKGFSMGIFEWKELFSSLLPDNVNGITCVLINPCHQNQSHTFEIHGGEATYMGEGDFHDTRFEDKSLETVLTEFDVHREVPGDDSDGKQDSNATSPTSCHLVVRISPSVEFLVQMESNGPLIFTMVIAGVFVVTGLIFLAYIYLVSNRQSKVMAIAQSTSAIVASLFPATVRDQIMKNAEEEVNLRMSQKKESKKALLRVSRRGGDRGESLRQLQKQRSMQKVTRSKPIADLIPEATVLFADIVGFTAWSSVREPTQVFELLETVYHSFDSIARRRGVFKVETIGDCYVAVTGLPEPSKDHAVTMCRFSRDCLQAMDILTKKLESTLGPDTGELSMRFGLHSGPVTAGVLRGERARFQLFGDTVNTAARMESNGARAKIHISEQTAEYLANAGKEDWYIPRADKIIAKGKGELQTYWLHTKKCSKEMSDVSLNEDSFDVGDWLDLPPELFSSQANLGFSTNKIRECLSEQNQRLADWNSNQLLQLLDNVVAMRKAFFKSSGVSSSGITDSAQEAFGAAHIGFGDDSNIINEAKDVIAMPSYDPEVFVKSRETPANISEVVHQQLHDFVSIICSMYVDNPYNNYQHASHVTMSITKIVTSLATPPQNTLKQDKKADSIRDEEERARHHSRTFGISSDPITHFALAFAALIHDVDHPGVTNLQLVKENKRLARIFKGRCIAEQNSFQCAWDLLMDPSFDYLRQAIYTTKEEFHHFRDLTINAVLATDLDDKEQNESRQKRWDLAFPEDSSTFEEAAPKASEKALSDRRATVVLEYVVQASDVAHTMQHWHVYRKWNERLFHESLKAHKAGRLEEDPCEFWYDQELEFFDNTIIPLAKKLKGCGAFGVYFDEYLTYATQNRQEWQRKGAEIVTEMQGKCENLAMGNSSTRSATDMEDHSAADL